MICRDGGGDGFIPTLGMMRSNAVAAAYYSVPGALDYAAAHAASPSRPSSPKACESSCASRARRDALLPDVAPAIEEAEDARNQAPRYDVLTLRRWFSSMDTDGSGCVDRQEWFDFLRRHPPLRAMLLRSTGGRCALGEVAAMDSPEGFKQGREDARAMRRLLKIWRELDTDQSGTLEWDEFVEFFRRSGHLLEYVTTNPQEQLAEKLRAMNEDWGSLGAKEMDSLKHLMVNHLSLENRRKLEPEIQKRRFARPESPNSPSKQTLARMLPELACSTPKGSKTAPVTPIASRRASDETPTPPCSSRWHAAAGPMAPPRSAWQVSPADSLQMMQRRNLDDDDSSSEIDVISVASSRSPSKRSASKHRSRLSSRASSRSRPRSRLNSDVAAPTSAADDGQPVMGIRSLPQADVLVNKKQFRPVSPLPPASCGPVPPPSSESPTKRKAKSVQDTSSLLLGAIAGLAAVDSSTRDVDHDGGDDIWSAD